MNLFDVYDRLAVTDGLVHYTQAAAWGFLAALAVMTAAFAFVRAALFGNGSEPAAWALRLLLVVGCLSSYGWLVDGMCDASRSMVHGFEQEAWQSYAQSVLTQFNLIFEDDDVNRPFAAGDGQAAIEPSMWDRLVGFVNGGILSVLVFASYYFEFVVFQFVSALSAVCLSLLRVMGPLLVAAGVLGDGRTLRQWFGSMVQVLLWPVVPPFLLYVIAGTSAQAMQSGNVAFVVGQNIVLALLGLLTPFVVSFAMGRGGIAAFGAAAIGLAVAALKSALPQVGGALGFAQGAGQREQPEAEQDNLAPRPADGVGAEAPGKSALAPRYPAEAPSQASRTRRVRPRSMPPAGDEPTPLAADAISWSGVI